MLPVSNKNAGILAQEPVDLELNVLWFLIDQFVPVLLELKETPTVLDVLQFHQVYSIHP